MRKIVDGKNVTLVADGFNDLADYVRDNADPNGSSHKEFSDKYHTDCYTLADGLEKFVNGWQGTSEQIDEIRNKVRQRIGSLDVSTFRFDNATMGQYLDVASFLAGEPTCMLQAYEDTSKRSDRFVRILVDVSYSWKVLPQDIAVRGGAIIALADALNHCGYSTEVWACVGVTPMSGTDVSTTLVPIQSHGSPWDTRSASFPLANGDYLRRVVFGAQESLTMAERGRWEFRSSGYYGIPKGSTKGCPADIHCGGADVVVQSNPGSISAIVADPVKWVLGQCENLGVITDAELV